MLLSFLCVVITVLVVQTAMALEPAKGMSAGYLKGDEYKEVQEAKDYNSTLTSAANSGLDMSTLITSDAANCMAKSYSFVIPRGYHSNGAVDTNVCNSINHANGAGIKTKDTYLFPCPTCSKSAATQGNSHFNDVVAHLVSPSTNVQLGSYPLFGYH